MFSLFFYGCTIGVYSCFTLNATDKLLLLLFLLISSAFSGHTDHCRTNDAIMQKISSKTFLHNMIFRNRIGLHYTNSLMYVGIKNFTNCVYSRHTEIACVIARSRLSSEGKSSLIKSRLKNFKRSEFSLIILFL